MLKDADDTESTEDSSYESTDKSTNDSSDEHAAVTGAGGGQGVGDRNLVWSGGGQ